MNHRGPRRRKEKGLKTFGEIMTENFPNLVKKTDIQVQEARRFPNKMNSETHANTHYN